MGLAIVARHGETQWNRTGRYQGRLESALTELGSQQAAALAAALGDTRLAAIVSSPLVRCIDTAAAVAAAKGLPVRADECLIEIGHGSWEGRLKDEITREDGKRMRAWRERPETVRFPGGESLEDVAARWRAAAATLRCEGNVLVVTHDVVVRLAILWATARPPSQLWKPVVRNGGYAVFDTTRAPWSLVQECCDAHLEGLLADASRQAL